MLKEEAKARYGLQRHIIIIIIIIIIIMHNKLEDTLEKPVVIHIEDAIPTFAYRQEGQ
jgi:hypothetical protein